MLVFVSYAAFDRPLLHRVAVLRFLHPASALAVHKTASAESREQKLETERSLLSAAAALRMRDNDLSGVSEYRRLARFWVLG